MIFWLTPGGAEHFSIWKKVGPALEIIGNVIIKSYLLLAGY